MQTFFHGWRRKTGVVTLMLACVLCGLWMRSHATQDLFFSPVVRRTQITLISTEGVLIGFTDFNSSFTPEAAPAWHAMKLPKRVSDLARSELEQKWCWRWLGVDIRKTGTQPPLPLLAVSHLSIVLPLTLLSAYLILWKPRKREPQGEPT